MEKDKQRIYIEDIEEANKMIEFLMIKIKHFEEYQDRVRKFQDKVREITKKVLDNNESILDENNKLKKEFQK